MPNGIDLILADHRDVEALFAEFDSTGQGALIGRIINDLQDHDDIEHGALYPLAGHLLGDAAMIERFSVAHSMVKKQIDLIKHLEGLPLTAAAQTLRELVAAHVADEEQNLLPLLSEQATVQQLEGLGARIMQIKQRVG
jgi:hemerythrin superfamily protein